MKPISLILSLAAAMLGFATETTRAALLFSDGDFGAQTVGLAVGAPWGPVGGGHIVAADSQSPYGNVYAGNGKGAHIPATGDNIYLVRLFPENAILPSATGTFYFNVDFRNNSGEAGDYSIVITRDSRGDVRSAAFFVTGDTLYAHSGTGVDPVLTLQQGTWYNLQITLDLATKTYAGVVSSPAGPTAITSRPFVNVGETINCVYTDGGTTVFGGVAPAHDLDNWALSDSPLSPPSGGAYVKSTAPHGQGWKPEVGIAIELEDRDTQVAGGSIQLTVNGQAVSPAIVKPAGSAVTTITYAPDGGWAPGTYNVRVIFSDDAIPPASHTNDFSFQVADPLVAALVVNVDFKGLRNVPGPDVQGPTYEGVGAGGGGRLFNGIVADSRLPGGGDDDNLTVGATDLFDSFGGFTTVGFTVSPMGGDVGWTPTTDPLSTAALFGDYVFNNSAGNTAGESPFQISGLGSVPFVDLYFYHTGGGVTIPGVGVAPFVAQGIFTPGNTYFFKRVPVTDGAVTGTFGSGTAVICGLSIVSPLPQPFLKSASPSGGGAQPNVPIVIELQDYVTEVDLSSIRLLVNGAELLADINKPAGSPVTTVTYTSPEGFIEGSTNTYTIIFGDMGSPSVVQTYDFTFVVLVGASAQNTINIDFNGLRTGDVQGPTYVGVGAAGGGTVFNGIVANSIIPGGGDDDNLTVGAENLLNSVGGATPVSFTISPVGGDNAGLPAGADPTAPASLFGDYVFVGSAGQLSGMADFTFAGLGSAPYVDLYFYYGAFGNFTVPGASASPFTTRGVFTPANTIYFKRVPVTDGTATGTVGTGPTTVLHGVTIQQPLPQPFVWSYAPSAGSGPKLRTNELGIIQIVLQDYITHVVSSSIQLLLNGQPVTPDIEQQPALGLTTVSYAPFATLLPDATNVVQLIFSDDAPTPVVQTFEFEFYVMSEAAAGGIVNIDFDGNRNVPGPNSLPLTFVGKGAAAGGTVFNGLPADSRLPGGGDDDNLTVSGTGLLSSIGTATPVSFTVAPMGGDSTAGRTGGNTDNPADPTALFSDYIFNNSAGNTAGQSPFTIDGLGSVASVDLYFYKGPGSVSIPGASPAPFAGSGIFTPGNTVFFRGAAVTDGKVTGSFGGGVNVIHGLTVVLPPTPVGSISIGRDGNNVIISWSGAGTLQVADEVTGGWTDLPGAPNPLILVSPQGYKFYRLRE